MLTINGWTILAHPLFLDQLEKLTRAVEALKAKKPDRYESHASTKLLAALGKLVFQTIPADPTATIYRQGSTLGDGHRHWFRAKFGNGRFRLFFRYDTAAKVIIFAWVPWRQPPRPPEGWSKNASPWGCDFGRAVQHWCRNLIRTILLRHWCWKDQRRIGDHRDRHEADRFVWAEQALAPAIDLLRLDAVALGRAGHVPARGGLFDDRPLLIGTPGPTSDVLFIAIHDQPPAVLPASVPDQSAAKLVGTTPLGKAAVTGGIYGVDPQAWLTDVLERIVSEEITVDRLGELLPWIWKAAKVGASTKEAA